MINGPTEISWRNAIFWIRYTYRNERVHSREKSRHWTPRRLLRVIRPNLTRPVFAIGAPRSGTTFLGQCLSELPEISYHFEPVITKAAVRYIHAGDWSMLKSKLLYRSTYAWLMRMSAETDLRFCEKTPGNCFIIPFLNEAFRDAKFIHIVRDGRDAALSLSKKPWYTAEAAKSGRRDPDGYPYGPSRRFWVEKDRVNDYEHTSNLHRCIWLWRRYVEEALLGAQAVPQDRLLQIRYEDLITAPADHAKRIADFLGIDDEPSRKKLELHMVENAYAGSIGRWREEMDPSAIQMVHDEAGTLLEHLGYADAPPRAESL